MSHFKLMQYVKAPIAGQAKTRLQPQFSAAEAAMIAQQLATRLAGQLHSWFGASHLELHIAGPMDHAFFADSAFNGMPQVPQITGDLGEKMRHSLNHALQQAAVNKAIIVGSDCVVFDRTHIQQVLLALDDVDLVLTPAEDGGYVLLASRVPIGNELANITWGQPDTLQQTLRQLQLNKRSYRLMPTLWDVDYAEDVHRAESLGLLTVSRETKF